MLNVGNNYTIGHRTVFMGNPDDGTPIMKEPVHALYLGKLDGKHMFYRKDGYSRDDKKVVLEYSHPVDTTLTPNTQGEFLIGHVLGTRVQDESVREYLLRRLERE